MHLCTSDWKNLSVFCSSNCSTMHKADDVDEYWVSTPEANASLPPSKPLEKHLPQEEAYEAQPLQGITSEFQQLNQHTMTEMDCASSPDSTANTNSLVRSKGVGPSPSMTTPEANSTQQQTTVDVRDATIYIILHYIYIQQTDPAHLCMNIHM